MRARFAWRHVALVGVASALAVTMPWRLMRHPWGRRAVVAQPGWDARDGWLELALSIREPPDLRPFEPILEEITGEPPLSHHHVSFRPASAAWGGRYRFWDIALFGVDEPRAWRQCAGSWSCDVDLCSGEEADRPYETELPRALGTWVHEQGHHFSRSPVGWSPPGRDRRWVEQIEAEALTFAFAEEVGRRHDRRLGARLLAQRLRPVADGLFQLRDTPRERLLDRLAWPDASEKTAWILAVLALRADGLDDFDAVWRFVHEQGAATVAERVRRAAGGIERGFALALEEMFAMAGSRVPPAPGEAPLSLPGPADEPVMLLRAACLEVVYLQYTAAFCREGWDARVEILSPGPEQRVLVRAGTERGGRCAVVAAESHGRPAWLAIEGRRAAVKAFASSAMPCLCTQQERLLSPARDAQSRAQLAGALDPLVAAAVRDVNRQGSPEDRLEAAAVVAQVAAALEMDLPLASQAVGW